MDNETATFDFVDYENTKNMYIDAHSAITRLGLWPWLSNYTPQEGKGFMFSSDPNINSIYGALKTSHSGATFALIGTYRKIRISSICRSIQKMML